MSVDEDLGRQSLLALFHEEVQTQMRALSTGLLTLGRALTDAAALEACMRAAHSFRGVARTVGLQDGVDVAHRIEEWFVAAQCATLVLTVARVNVLLRGTDLLLRADRSGTAGQVPRAEVDTVLAAFSAPEGATAALAPATTTFADAEPAAEDATVKAAMALLNAEVAALSTPPAPPTSPASSARVPKPSTPAPNRAPINTTRDPHRMLRVRADNFDRLLSLSGKSLVKFRWLKPFGESMLRVKRSHRAAALALDALYETLVERLDRHADADMHAALNDARQMFGNMQQMLGEHIDDLGCFDRRSTHLAQQLYDEALRCRMRPLGDATHAYSRVVCDLAHSLGKRVRFNVVGEATQVNRDIPDMLDIPLGHLLCNAVDYGVETPQAREAQGRPAEAPITLEVRHSAGKLLITMADNGAGIDLEAMRAAVVRQRLSGADTASRLSDHELLNFLLSPGFSIREQVTDVSGRGVGLDAVHEMVKAVRGTVRIHNEPGRGTHFMLQLPLTLFVIRSLLVDVGGEAYAFPPVYVQRTLELACAEIDMLEGQQHFSFEGRPVGLVTVHQLLGTQPPGEARDSVPVVVIGEGTETYDVAVDRFPGECMLVAQPLDTWLDEVYGIAAGVLIENGDAVLIVDVDDLLRSVDKLVRGGQLDRVQRAQGVAVQQRKHVLVVDDSLTVRELERKLLEKRGYAVTVTVDGVDGWNTLRGADFDLVVTDVDMLRMDGIELVTLIKRDAALKALLVMVVSYKDREKDRRRGLDAGADCYLAKGSFHDEALFDVVRDLIGEAWT